MKGFRTLAVVRQDRERVWTLVRDRLDELVPLISDVDSVTVDSRREDPDGTVHLVNLWRAKADVPALLRTVVKPEMLAWTDRAEWLPSDWVCRWRIEPQVFSDRVDCVGETRYEEAMGGTRDAHRHGGRARRRSRQAPRRDVVDRRSYGAGDRVVRHRARAAELPEAGQGDLGPRHPVASGAHQITVVEAEPRVRQP